MIFLRIFEGGRSDDDDDNPDDHNDAWTNLHGIEVATVGPTDLPHKEDFPIGCKYMLRMYEQNRPEYDSPKP